MKKSLTFIVSMLLVVAMVLGACQPKPEVPPTEEPVVEEPVIEDPVVEEPVEEAVEEPVEEEPARLVCEEPIKIGLISDITGLLQSYGDWMVRSFMLGMEYATGAPGSAGENSSSRCPGKCFQNRRLRNHCLRAR